MTALGVALLSLAVRVWVLTEQLATNPMLRAAWLDDGYYIAFARALTEGVPRSWFMAPAYPGLLALAAPFGGGEIDLALACWVNVPLGVGTSVAIALCARSLHSPAAGWIAGLLHALLGAFAFLDTTPGQEPLLCLLHVLAFATALWLARRVSVSEGGRVARGVAWPAGALGVASGLAVLGRSTSIVLLLGLLPVLRRLGARGRGVAMGAAAAGLLAALVPAALVNGTLNGDPNPLPWGGGPVLYFGNGPDSRASTSYLAMQLGDTAARIEANAVGIARAEAGTDLDVRQVSRWWLARTWNERGSLAELATHQARKAVLFLSARERGSTHALSTERDFSLWLRLAPAGVWWILAGGAAAWWLLRRRLPQVDAAAWMFGGSWLLLALVFPLARYRLPITCVALVVLAAGCVEAARGAERSRLLGSLALAAGFTLLAWWPLRAQDDALAHVNVARAHAQLGDDPALARERLDRVLRVQPAHGPAHELYGRLLLAQAEPRRALEHLTSAARDPRTRFGARVPMVVALVDLGRASEARALAEELMIGRPNDAELLAFAALSFWATGDRERAARTLHAARRLAPNSRSIAVVGRRTGL